MLTIDILNDILYNESMKWKNEIVKWNKEDIKAFRKQLGLSQRKFAELLGVTERYVVYLEAGQRKPFKTLEKLLDCLKEQMKGGK